TSACQTIKRFIDLFQSANFTNRFIRKPFLLSKKQNHMDYLH
ncbi:unnamed protein product, partial [Rotaria sp. Silwood1]